MLIRDGGGGVVKGPFSHSLEVRWTGLAQVGGCRWAGTGGQIDARMCWTSGTGGRGWCRWAGLVQVGGCRWAGAGGQIDARVC